MNLELKNINFFKIIFTIGIIYGHTIQHYMMHQYANLPFFQHLIKHTSYNYNYFVEMFFIISGFFMFFTFAKNNSFKTLLVNKIARLWPVLIFCILIFYILSLFDICSYARFDNILAAFFLSDALAEAHENIGVSWYINVLFWTFIMYYLLFKIVKPENRIPVVSLIIFFVYTILFNKVDLYASPKIYGGGDFNIQNA